MLSSSAIRCRSAASTAMWASAGQAATIGIFLLLFGAFLYVGRAILLPISRRRRGRADAGAAGQSRQAARHFALDLGLLILVVRSARSALAVNRARRAGQRMDRARTRDRRQHQAKAHRARPAARLAARTGDCSVRRRQRTAQRLPRPTWCFRSSPFSRRRPASFCCSSARCCSFWSARSSCATSSFRLFAERDSKLRFLHIMSDIESNLAGYLTVVTIDQRRARRHRRARRMAHRLSQSGDFRSARGIAELRALCRTRHHGDRRCSASASSRFPRSAMPCIAPVGARWP